MVQTLSDWNTSAKRGTLIGKLSTSYTVGHVLSWLLAGVLCDHIGWRAAFMIPGLLLPAAAAVFFLLLRDSPADVGLAPVRDDVGCSDGTANPESIAAPGTLQVLRMTLGSGILWVLAICFFVMNAVRYSFMNWSVQYMADFHGRSIKGSVLTAILLPLVGALGALSAGWASDVFFARRRVPVCVIMLLGLTATCAGMALVPQGDWILATVVMAVAGFMIYGPDVLIAGAATVDLSHPKAASVATGLTMCMGALGAVFSGSGVGYLKDLGQGSWSLVFEVLAGMTLLPALLIATLWNAKPRPS